jgi:hypothetical protein
VFGSDDLTGIASIWLVQYTGSWQAAVKIIDGDGETKYTFAYPRVRTPLQPEVGGEKTNIPTAGYALLYANTGTAGGLRYHGSATLDYPAPADKHYSRSDEASLPATDSTLSNTFTAQEYSNVLTDDNEFVDQTATNEYAIKLFKNKATNPNDEIYVNWKGKTNIAPASSTVYLQIYNRNDSTWETLDTNSTASANIEFTLSGAKTTNLTRYYNANNWASFRVLQLAQ